MSLTLVMAAILYSSCRVPLRVEQLHGGLKARLLPKLKLKPKSSDRRLKAGGGGEDLPAEIRDDAKFVPLNAEDPSYGPTAMLLVGFEKQEISKIEKYLEDMDAEFVKVIVCDRKMLKDTLWGCMHTKEQDVKRVELVPGLPRICFMSGMSGEEIMTIVHTFPQIGLEDNAFAALVPKNAHTLVEEVIEEVRGDHERLAQRKSQSG